MRRFALLSLSLLVLASHSHAAQDGIPARVKSIGDWEAHDPAGPEYPLEPWTTSDAVDFLALYPNTVFDVGVAAAKPPGILEWKQTGTRVEALQALAGQRQVAVDGRLCVDERPDVMTRQTNNLYACHPSRSGGGCDWEGDMDGSLGESETVVKVAGRASGGADDRIVDAGANWFPGLWVHRLAVLRPNSADEEVIRIVDSDETSVTVAQPWSKPPQPGDDYEIRGSFDPTWVARVSRDTYEETLTRFWTNLRNVCGADGQQPCGPPAEPLDPFDPANQRGWEPWIDRASHEALRTSSSVPALYGYVYEKDEPYTYQQFVRRWEDPYYRVTGVIMDLTNPAYRAWRIRYLLYKLADYGFEPGEGVCLQVGYKPGWHTFHDESQLGPGTYPCSEAGTNTWIGPAHVCRDRSAVNGPFAPTPFGPGEFESGISAYFRELTSTLAANGYSQLRVVTAEAPTYRDITWSTLEEDVRKNPKMLGNWNGWLNPPLSALADRRAPVPADPSGPASNPGAPDAPIETAAPPGETGAPTQTPTPTGSGTVASGGTPAAGPSTTPGGTSVPSTGPSTTPTSVAPAPTGGSEPTSSFSLGTPDRSNAGQTSFSDTNDPLPSTTSPDPVDTTASAPATGGGAATASQPAPPAPSAPAGTSAASSKPERRGYMTSGGGGGGGGTVHPPDSP